MFVFGIQDAELDPQKKLNLEFGAFFCYGVCMHYFQDIWRKRRKLTLSALTSTGTLLMATGEEYFAWFSVLPALVIFVGTASTPLIRHAGRFGDISYSLYIYAFPVQQTVILLSENSLPIWGALAVSTVITVVLALLSWHLVEYPALRLISRFPTAISAPKQKAVKLNV